MRHERFAAVAMTMALLGTGLGPHAMGPAHAQSTAPELEAQPCPFEIPFGETARCGHLTVPADHDRPEAGSYKVFFAILGAHAARPAPDPVVHLAGGPGQAMSDFARPMWFETVADRAHRDAILFDMRGTGLSQPVLDCAGIDDDVVDANPANDGPMEPAQIAAALVACREGYAGQGIDIAHFDTTQAARDLKALRGALGIERWNLVGTSYGTRLALETARQDPDGIRSLVLNSTMTMGDALEPQVFDDRVRILNRLFADCAANEACSGAFPDLKDRYERLRARLETTPLRVHVVPPGEAESGGPIEVVLDFPTFVGVLMMHMSSQSGVEMVPVFIDRIAKAVAGTENMMDEDWRTFLGPSLHPGGNLALGLHLSVMCREVGPVHDGAGAASRVAESSLFSPRALDVMTRDCPAWAPGAARRGFAAPVRSDVPALLLFGEYDPLTPPYWTAAAVAALENGRAIAFPGAAHDVHGSSLCAQNVVTAFIRAPDEDLDTACVEGQLPRFFIPAQGGSAPVGGWDAPGTNDGNQAEGGQ